MELTAKQKYELIEELVCGTNFGSENVTGVMYCIQRICGIKEPEITSFKENEFIESIKDEFEEEVKTLKPWLVQNEDGSYEFPAGDENLKSIGKIVKRFKQLNEEKGYFFSDMLDISFEDLRIPNKFGKDAYDLLHNVEYRRLLAYWCDHANEYLKINSERNNEAFKQIMSSREQLRLI